MQAGAGWGHDPLYDEIIRIPLLMYVPGVKAGVYDKLTAAVDVMPTVMHILEQPIPEHVEGDSLLERMHDLSLPGREFVISGKPFANPGAEVRHVDNFLRRAKVHSNTVVTTDEWSLLYAAEAGKSELYHRVSDPRQERDVAKEKEDVARDMHQHLVKFMGDTGLEERLRGPRGGVSGVGVGVLLTGRWLSYIFS